MRMHEILGVEPGEVFGYKNVYCEEVKYSLDAQGNVFRAVEDHKRVPSPREIVDIINHPDRIIHKPRPGCWHCWNIEAHKIEYVTAVKDKDGRPMNTPTDIPYRYCPSCGRKLEVEE